MWSMYLYRILNTTNWNRLKIVWYLPTPNVWYKLYDHLGCLFLYNDVWTYSYNSWYSRKLTGPFELYSASAESYQGKKIGSYFTLDYLPSIPTLRSTRTFSQKLLFFIFRVAIEAKQYWYTIINIKSKLWVGIGSTNSLLQLNLSTTFEVSTFSHSAIIPLFV